MSSALFFSTISPSAKMSALYVAAPYIQAGENKILPLAAIITFPVASTKDVSWVPSVSGDKYSEDSFVHLIEIALPFEFNSAKPSFNSGIAGGVRLTILYASDFINPVVIYSSGRLTPSIFVDAYGQVLIMWVIEEIPDGLWISDGLFSPYSKHASRIKCEILAWGLTL